MKNDGSPLLDSGIILKFNKIGNNLRTDPHFIQNYISYRDPYYGGTPDPDDFNEIKRRDGSFFPYDYFMDLWKNSEVGVYLQINDFEDPSTVNVVPLSYSNKDLQNDSGKPSVNEKIILTKESYDQAKSNWDSYIASGEGRPFTEPKIALGVGASAKKEPVVFVQLSDDDFYTNETNSPVRVPKGK